MFDSSTILEFTRVYLAAFYTFVAVFYAVRIALKKRAGMAVVVFPGERFCPSWWNHMVFRAFRITIWLVCVFRLIYLSIDGYLGIIDALNTAPLVLLGNAFLTLGFVATATVHFQLGRGWRSGIDPIGPAKLSTDKAFSYSRNPMFVAIALAQFGFFLALPSLFSAVCLMFGWFVLHRQVIAEELHLKSIFDGEYLAYQGRVRRWL